VQGGGVAFAAHHAAGRRPGPRGHDDGGCTQDRGVVEGDEARLVVDAHHTAVDHLDVGVDQLLQRGTCVAGAQAPGRDTGHPGQEAVPPVMVDHDHLDVAAAGWRQRPHGCLRTRRR
jgi:hypothetical protein